MKICYDCKFCNKVVIGEKDFSKCLTHYDVDPVTGRKKYRFCSVARGFEKYCGEEAKHFEQFEPIIKKEAVSWWKRLFSWT